MLRFTHLVTQGAIEIFKRTNSLQDLKNGTGYLILNVSLTNLKGLEKAVLKDEYMPMV